MKRPHKFFAIRDMETNQYLTNQGTWHSTLHRNDTTKVATRFWKNIAASCKYAASLNINSLEIVDGSNKTVVSNNILTWPNLWVQSYSQEEIK
jgi:hypothetical protein